VLVGSVRVPVGDIERGTGWSIKPEGACRGELCVPLPASARPDEATVDVTALADRLGAPLVFDDAHGVWALGPATVSGRALTTAVAPELVLPDWKGEVFRLSSLRGAKVVLIAWAPF